MVLTIQQQQVLDKIKEFMSNDASVFILCGYAGTGKTTMIKQIADYILQSTEIKLMAPTGRAARVLQSKTGYEATTIHKAIYGNAYLETEVVDDIAETDIRLHFPIKISDHKCVAIVDEASMLCSHKSVQEMFSFGTDNLMDDLLTFIRPSFGGKVIFVGDPIQLPPVGENISNALNADFFIQKGLKVMEAELTEVLRQTGDSVILKNAMQIRDLFKKEKRNRLVFEEKKNDVESLPSGELLKKYIEIRKKSKQNDSVVICYSNKSAYEYNMGIRRELYDEEEPELRAGDILLIVQNNYVLNLMNGDFVQVVCVGEKIKQSAPVYVQEGGNKKRKIIDMEFVNIQMMNSKREVLSCKLLLDFLNSRKPALEIDEQRALFINFRIRNPYLKLGTEEFVNALKSDGYFNCLKAKYGYAVTGHKCQGGEWKNVFIDYSGRTGLSDDCLRWAYTATTRAREKLYFTNLPHITPFAKFRIESIQQCSKINDECRIIGNVESSPFHSADAPNYLHAKWMCIENNLKWTPYKIDKVESKPYQEIYYIKTPDGVERYDIRYKKGGIFLKAIPHNESRHNVIVCMMLNDEHAMPLIFNYVPSDEIYESLYSLIRSVCDELSIQITNVVEHKEDYSIIFYFRTSDSFSYIKIYINESGYVTYAKPMSLLGKDDKELENLIEKMQNHFK